MSSSNQRRTRRGGWKPFTLGVTFLASLTLVTTLGILAVELVVQTSGQDYSLNIPPNDGSGRFGAGITFVNLYLPTIIAVIYSLAWIWVNLRLSNNPFSILIRR